MNDSLPARTPHAAAGGPRRGRRRAAAPFLLALALLLAVQPAAAQSPGPAGAAPTPAGPAAAERLRVAIRPLEPFVMQREGQWTGFSVELWEALAEALGVETEWLPVGTVPELLEAVETGRADLAITAISVTAEREERVDFSLPYFNGGLQVLSSDLADASEVNVLRSYGSMALLQIALLALAIGLVMAHVIWLLERRDNPNFQRGYLRGLWEGSWWLQSVVATGESPGGGDQRAPRRLLQLSLWLLGVVLIAQFTAVVTADLTVDQLNDSLRGVEDLPGKRVVTVRGTTAAAWLRDRHLPAREVAQIEDAYDLLESRQADAVVYDAPVLQYYVAYRGQGRAHVVGDLIRPEYYGIALPEGSRWRKPINRALLALYESGEHEALYRWWFDTGGPPEP